MSDVPSVGRKVRVFTVMDDCNLEVPTMDVGLNYLATRVVETFGYLEKEIRITGTICVTTTSGSSRRP